MREGERLSIRALLLNILKKLLKEPKDLTEKSNLIFLELSNNQELDIKYFLLLVKIVKKTSLNSIYLVKKYSKQLRDFFYLVGFLNLVYRNLKKDNF